MPSRLLTWHVGNALLHSRLDTGAPRGPLNAFSRAREAAQGTCDVKTVVDSNLVEIRPRKRGVGLDNVVLVGCSVSVRGERFLSRGRGQLVKILCRSGTSRFRKAARAFGVRPSIIDQRCGVDCI